MRDGEGLYRLTYVYTSFISQQFSGFIAQVPL